MNESGFAIATAFVAPIALTDGTIDLVQTANSLCMMDYDSVVDEVTDDFWSCRVLSHSSHVKRSHELDYRGNWWKRPYSY